MRHLALASLTALLASISAVPGLAQEPPKLYRCQTSPCAHRDPSDWVEIAPGGVFQIGGLLGARIAGIDPPANLDMTEGWGWSLRRADGTPVGPGASLLYPANTPPPPRDTFHYSGSHDGNFLFFFFSGDFIARWFFQCGSSPLPGAYTMKFHYTPPYLPNTPPPPTQDLGAVDFVMSEAACYAAATTDSDPDNRPAGAGSEPGQLPGVGEEPDPTLPCTAVGKPVEVTTGNVFFDQTDAVVPGPGAPLVFTRSYNSKNAGTGGIFGPGWTFSHETALTFPAPGEVVMHEGRGTAALFADPDGDGSFGPRRRAKHVNTILRQANNTWKRTFARGGHELYDRWGHVTELKDAVGNVTAIQRSHPQGPIVVVGSLIIDYGANGRPSRLRNARNDHVYAEYGFYPDGLLQTVTYPDGSGYTYTYHAATKELWQVIDHTSRVLETHTYADGKGITSEIAGGKEKYSLAYEPGRTTVTDALNRSTVYDWSTVADRKLVTKIAGPCGGCGGGQQVQEWTYAADSGAVQTYKDGNGNETSYTYYADTKRLETIAQKPDPSASYVTRYTYHPDGRVHQRFDPNGGLTTLTYGPAGPTQISRKVTATETRTTSIEYDWWFQAKPWRITDPRGKATEISYLFGFLDNGLLGSVTDPLGHVTTFQYDALGRQKKVVLPATDPPSEEPTVYYDARGRVRFVVDPGGTADETAGTCTKCTHYAYDDGGRLESRRDALGREIHYGYDAYGRLTDITHAATADVTRFTYDDMSNLQTIEDPRGKITDFDYDGYDRVWRVTYPPVEGDTPRVEQFTYYPDGLLWTRTDRKGVTTTFEYDDLGRLKRKTYSDGSPAVTYGYDAAGLTSAANATSSLSWTYDYAGQFRTATDAHGTIVYDYEPSGQRKSLTFSGGFGLTYHYDDAGRLQYMRRGTQQFEFVPDEASRRRELRYPNGTVTTYTPDLLSRVQRIKVAAGETALNQIDYGYDDVWNVAWKDAAGLRDDYTYDDLYRLTDVQRNAAAPEHYGYDAAGNRSLLMSERYAWYYNDRNELLGLNSPGGGGTEFTYDPNGNQLTKLVRAGLWWTTLWDYEWDVENRLTRVLTDQSEAARFTYDALGRRATKTVGGVTTNYTYDGMDILRETRPSEAVTFIHGPHVDEPLAREAVGGTLTYYHADALGSIVKTTNEASEVVDSYSYDSFGNLETPHTGGYAFTGREWDPETGLYYYRARYYDPMIGRFVGEDPIGFSGGLNFYTYVGNVPALKRDPFGLIPWKEAQAKGWSRNRYIEHLKNLDDAIENADTEMVAAVFVSMKAFRLALDSLRCRVRADSDRTPTMPPPQPTGDVQADNDLYWNELFEQLRARRGGQLGNRPDGTPPASMTESGRNVDQFFEELDTLFRSRTGREPPWLP